MQGGYNIAPLIGDARPLPTCHAHVHARMREGGWSAATAPSRRSLAAPPCDALPSPPRPCLTPRWLATDALEDAEVAETACTALKHTILVFDAFHDVKAKMDAGNEYAKKVIESWAAAEWFTSKPEVKKKLTFTVFKASRPLLSPSHEHRLLTPLSLPLFLPPLPLSPPLPLPPIPLPPSSQRLRARPTPTTSPPRQTRGRVPTSRCMRWR